jgi:hypothetical protein
MEQWALDKIKGTWRWYMSRPNWQKAFLWVGLVVIVLLVVVAALGVVVPSNKKPSGVKPDDAHSEMVDDVMEDLDNTVTELKTDVVRKKKELAERLNQADTIDAKTLERRDKISGARTMEELDKLQKEYDL